MKRLLFTAILFSISVSLSFSQENRIDFKVSPTKSKVEIEKPDFRAVSFKLIGVANDEKRAEIENLLNNSGFIMECKLQLSGKCFMFVKEDKTADYIRKTLLLPNYVDYDFISVVVNDKSLMGKSESIVPADFPQFIDTGNPEQDNIDFATRKDDWIENNPEKYKEINSGNSSPEEERRNEIISIEKAKTN